MGISRDSLHKRRKTGGKRAPLRKKRKFELGRPAANTKLGAKRIHSVRTRGGNSKSRALRLDTGNFSWGSENQSRKTRVLDVVYNASNNELVRTKTIVKNCIVTIDAAPFRQWYEGYYGISLVKKRKNKAAETEEEKPKSKNELRRFKERKDLAKIDPHVEEQLHTGRVLACISSRPGQSGRADGYILEGRELEFYQRKLRSKKGK
ncbi:small ribosomal subunit protein eS8-like [Sycon ciliatum]|uniref:40S ribosomal protein S8 n=1 Tax=Sycon ciliatum TaxID=27933 RepID=M1XK21_9METZ|nr:40S ribosomal protein S8 [Sycon ciliatum]|eukprot:scpid91888/ scgid12796/ 40S ribosomal protein S8